MLQHRLPQSPLLSNPSFTGRDDQDRNVLCVCPGWAWAEFRSWLEDQGVVSWVKTVVLSF